MIKTVSITVEVDSENDATEILDWLTDKYELKSFNYSSYSDYIPF